MGTSDKKNGKNQIDDSFKEKFLAAIVQSSEDAVIGEDLQGLIISWNPAAESMFGYTPDEAIGKSMSIIGPKDKVEEFQIIIDRVKKGEKIERYETQRKTKSGTIIDVSVTVSPVRDDSDNIIGISAIDRDISGEKRAAGYARSLIEASLDPLVTINTDGKITDVNEATITATGVQRKELIGSRFSDYFTDQAKADEGYKRVYKEGLVRDYPLTIKHKNGKQIEVLYNASVYKDNAGKVLGVFAAARDITEQKQASQYSRSLIEASLDPLVTISVEGNITDVNEATIKITGASRDELIGSKFSQYFTEPSKAEEGYQTVLKQGAVQDYALTIKDKNNKLTDVLYNAAVYKDIRGKVIGVFAAARDVTKTKQASQYARSLIEASLDPLVTISVEGNITDVNEATIRVTGAPRQELIGSKFSQYFTDPSKADEGYQTVLKQGSVQDYALTIKDKLGKLTDVLYNASVYKDVQGNVIGIFAAARDVTKTKQASEYARSLIEASVDPLVTISPDGKITDVNEATMRATGVARETLIGTNFSQYFTEPVLAEKGYQQVLREGAVKDYPLTIRHKNGRLIEVSYNASIYRDAQGKIIGVFAAARDVTESKIASQYARSLIEASLDPLVTISPDGKITDVNNATVEVTGVQKNELIGSEFSLYFTDSEKAKSGYQEAFEKGEVRDYLLTIRNRLGKETPVLYNASVYKDDKGQVLGVFAAAREIGKAELKAAQARELQRVSKKLIFKVVPSYRMSKGTIKISEKDATKVGIEIVDSVTIKPTKESVSARRITTMSLTNSKLMEGNVVMSFADIKALGLEEGDTVFVLPAGAKEDVELVDEENLVPKPFVEPERLVDKGSRMMGGIKAAVAGFKQSGMEGNDQKLAEDSTTNVNPKPVVSIATEQGNPKPVVLNATEQGNPKPVVSIATEQGNPKPIETEQTTETEPQETEKETESPELGEEQTTQEQAAETEPQETESEQESLEQGEAEQTTEEQAAETEPQETESEQESLEQGEAEQTTEEQAEETEPQETESEQESPEQEEEEQAAETEPQETESEQESVEQGETDTSPEKEVSKDSTKPNTPPSSTSPNIKTKSMAKKAKLSKSPLDKSFEDQIDALRND